MRRGWRVGVGVLAGALVLAASGRARAGGPGGETPMGGWNQYFGYDGANRLRLAMERRGGAPGNVDSVSCSGIQTNWTGGEWCQQFGFDGFGNIWSEAGQTQGTTALVANGPAWYDQAKNRLRNVVYDAAGNQTQLQVNDASVVTEYDGEGRILRRRSGGGVLFEYGYGPGGQRVQTRVGSVVTRYVYGVDGELVAEYGAEGTSGGQKPEYLLTDTLGSTRGKTDGEGLVLARFDYEPFGGEIGRNGSARDGLRQRFTGKERDAETGLDYFGARYFSGAQGRMTSPDIPGADQWTVNPQSWNLYSYVRNNPLRFVDPRGRECVQVSGGFNGWADDGKGTFCDKVDTGTAASSTTSGGGDVTPVEVGWEWLTGTGPRQRTFTEEDRFTQMLRQHNHINLVIGAIQSQLGNCQTPTPQSLKAAGTNPNYNLSGIEGVPKYINDYSTLASGGTTGNLAVTYLGSYGLSFNVNNVNASVGTASVSFHASNVSSIASGTRPPVIGYTQAYQNTVGRALNDAFNSGAMSPTQQDFFWTQQVSFNGGGCR